jgi:hypothetical protein
MDSLVIRVSLAGHGFRELASTILYEQGCSSSFPWICGMDIFYAGFWI